MRLIDADELSKDDEMTKWLSKDAIRKLFLKKISNAPTVEAIPKEKMIEMYDKIIKTSYDMAESYPKYKGIMLFEAQIIIDIMKEYLFKENINKATCGELKEAIEPCTVKDIYTKADMVALLTELLMDIEKMSGLWTEIRDEEWYKVNMVHSQDVLNLIQQKINALRADKEEKDEQ